MIIYIFQIKLTTYKVTPTHFQVWSGAKVSSHLDSTSKRRGNFILSCFHNAWAQYLLVFRRYGDAISEKTLINAFFNLFFPWTAEKTIFWILINRYYTSKLQELLEDKLSWRANFLVIDWAYSIFYNHYVVFSFQILFRLGKNKECMLIDKVHYILDKSWGEWFITIRKK